MDKRLPSTAATLCALAERKAAELFIRLRLLGGGGLASLELQVALAFLCCNPGASE